MFPLLLNLRKQETSISPEKCTRERLNLKERGCQRRGNFYFLFFYHVKVYNDIVVINTYKIRGGKLT